MRRIRVRWQSLAVLVVTGLAALGAAPNETDPFQWLEDVQGEKALAWAKEQNAKSTRVLEARPEYEPIYKRDARDPRLEREDPDAVVPRRSRLQLLEGRRPRARDLAPHDACLLSHGDPRVGNGSRRRRARRRPKARHGSSTEPTACRRPTSGA
jgi:hypothetical protein